MVCGSCKMGKSTMGNSVKIGWKDWEYSMAKSNVLKENGKTTF